MSLDSFNHKKDEEMRESYETTLKDNKNNAVAFLKNISRKDRPVHYRRRCGNLWRSLSFSDRTKCSDR